MKNKFKKVLKKIAWTKTIPAILALFCIIIILANRINIEHTGKWIKVFFTAFYAWLMLEMVINYKFIHEK